MRPAEMELEFWHEHVEPVMSKYQTQMLEAGLIPEGYHLALVNDAGLHELGVTDDEIRVGNAAGALLVEGHVECSPLPRPKP
jgi:hypothetical protein